MCVLPRSICLVSWLCGYVVVLHFTLGSVYTEPNTVDWGLGFGFRFPLAFGMKSMLSWSEGLAQSALPQSVSQSASQLVSEYSCRVRRPTQQLTCGEGGLSGGRHHTIPDVIYRGVVILKHRKYFISK